MFFALTESSVIIYKQCAGDILCILHTVKM